MVYDPKNPINRHYDPSSLRARFAYHNLYKTMKPLKEILFVTEKQPENEWYVSLIKPEFVGGEAIQISEEDAKKLISIINYL